MANQVNSFNIGSPPPAPLLTPIIRLPDETDPPPFTLPDPAPVVNIQRTALGALGIRTRNDDEGYTSQ